MYDTAVTCGFVPIAAISGIAEHFIDREMAKSCSDSIDRAALKEFGDKIKHPLTVQPDLNTYLETDHIKNYLWGKLSSSQ